MDSKNKNSTRSIKNQDSRQHLKDFIGLYHYNHPLWNTRHPDYSKHSIRGDCYDQLVEKLQEVQPDATREDVVKKINSIRCSFRKEYRKVIQQAKMGSPYTPKLWYYKHLQFLLEIEPGSQDAEDSTQVEHEDHLQNTTETADTPETITGDGYVMEHVFDSSIVKTEKKTGRAKKETHADVFGRHVAFKLAAIDREQRIYLEKLINDAIFEAELGNLSRDSKILVD